MAEHHIAQLNIGEIRYPLDHPEMAPFMDRLDEVNALADRSPGFVWRLQDAAGNATAFRPFADARDMLINMSLWRTIEALYEFAYGPMHLAVLRGRARWFQPATARYLALWWVPAGHIPSLDEAVERLARLEREGPSPAAFDFGARFPAP